MRDLSGAMISLSQCPLPFLHCFHLSGSNGTAAQHLSSDLVTSDLPALYGGSQRLDLFT